MDLDEKIARVPDRPGVYVYRDGKQQVLYVGKAASLRSRVRSYFQESRPRDPKTDALVRQIRDLEYIVTDNELEALMLEANLVRRHRPRYNIILRDDKHYPFLKLTTNEEFPRLVVARKVQHDGARYYGPFYPATAMRETLRLTRQLFPLRTCSITIDGSLERPCIQYAIHRCNAPCTGWETREGYARTVDDVAHFLEGRDEELARRLTKEMEEAAAELKFERATVLRDQIQSLNKVRERQKIISTDDVDQDVVGVVRQGSDACVELFFVRKGRLVGQEPFFFDKVAGWTDGEILSAFVRQFYGKAVTPAPEILLSEELPEAELTPSGGCRSWRRSAGASGSSSPWPRRTRRSRSRTVCSPGTTASSWSSRSSSARSTCPGSRTVSRATTSRTSREPSRSARWSSGKTAE